MPGKHLYDLAIAFYKTKLWNRLYDSELFAVRLPDGEIGYCSVMGALGEHLALAVYPGQAGLDSFRLLYEEHAPFSLPGPDEHLFLQDCISISFEDRAELDPPRLTEIRSLGYTFRGKNAYPVFQRMRSRRYPWYLNDPQDEALLAAALTAAIAISNRLTPGAQQCSLPGDPPEGASKSSLGFSEGLPFDRNIPLIRIHREGALSWDTMALPEPQATDYASPAIADQLLIARLKKMEHTGIMECGLFFLPTPIEDDPSGHGLSSVSDAPFFPFVLLAVDSETGLVLHTDLAGIADDWADALLMKFVQSLSRTGRPRKILVPDDRTYALLATAMKQAKIQVEQTEDLQTLAEAAVELVESMASEASHEISESEIMDLLTALYEQGLPSDLLFDQLNQLLHNDAIPDSLRKRLSTQMADMLQAPPNKPAPPSGTPQSYVISVSLQTGCYRHIRISANATLWDLHSAIVAAFDFDDDHLHAFFMDNRAWSKWDAYYAPQNEEADRQTDDYTLQQAGLQPDKAFLYIFDFGAEWRFKCKVLRVLQEDTDTAQLIRSKGKAPAQYDDSDW